VISVDGSCGRIRPSTLPTDTRRARCSGSDLLSGARALLTSHSLDVVNDTAERASPSVWCAECRRFRPTQNYVSRPTNSKALLSLSFYLPFATRIRLVRAIRKFQDIRSVATKTARTLAETSNSMPRSKCIESLITGSYQRAQTRKAPSVYFVSAAVRYFTSRRRCTRRLVPFAI